MKTMKRTLIADSVNKIGENVKLCGWVNTVRAHGKVLFCDLRDRTGTCQIIFTPQDKELYKEAQKLRSEWVVSIEGVCQERPEGMRNEKIKTGKIEILANKLEVFSASETPPFSIETDGYEISEEKRLKYRYLDLRRERLQNNLRNRHKVIQFMRDYLTHDGFVEIETPVITKSTPEGARDFLVPSRLDPGKFYALPQSPQQYKQLLMVAGFEKYFQIVKCFRDEDPRGDRQAEFTQLDIEMSFCTQEEILDLIENLYTKIIKELFPEKKITKIPFPRLTYKEAMEKYKSDKPDLRKNTSTSFGTGKKDPNELAFCFVVDFPMFDFSEGKGKLIAMHHPFTMPKIKKIDELKNNTKNVLSFQHDFVLNGYEIAGGSIRTHTPEILEATFETLGHSKKEIKEKFGHLLEAFRYGVPPHGGIAPGLDRFFAVLFNEPNIREVIAFPKTGDNRDLMMSAPSDVTKEQLKELGLKIINKK